MGVPTEKQRIGKIGEDIAEMFLVKHGFLTVLRNYRKKFGEIDIICKKDNRLHFIEVKTVSRGTQKNVSRETNDAYRPEDNIHEFKLKRIGRAIQAYLIEFDYDLEWQFDAITVNLDEKTKIAKVRYIEGLVL